MNIHQYTNGYNFWYDIELHTLKITDSDAITIDFSEGETKQLVEFFEFISNKFYI